MGAMYIALKAFVVYLFCKHTNKVVSQEFVQ